MTEHLFNYFSFYMTTLLLIVVASSIWLLYLIRTDLFLQFGLNFFRSISGLRVKFQPRKCGQGIWCYAEKGKLSKKYPTFVFLHGFGGSKDDWPMIVKNIPAKYHIITIDLPGHGDTTFVNGHDEPTVHGYADALHEFFEMISYDFSEHQVYLIGCSFGGAIASMFAHKYAKYVKLLALMCPALPSPTPTDTYKQVMDGKYNILIPNNGQEFMDMLNIFCFKKYYFPNKILQTYVNMTFTDERRNLLIKLMHNLVTNELHNFETDFKHRFSELKTKTLVLWGKNDEMLHVSGATYLKERLENAHVKIMDECGHVMQFDQPKRTTQYLIEFYKQHLII